MRSVMEAMNVMYDVEEDRPFYTQYAICITLLVVALMLTALGLGFFGQSVGGGLAESLGFGGVFQTVWTIAQWPILAFLVLFAFIYYFAPAADQKFRWISPGSLVAFAFWLLFSLIFSCYVSNFGSYNETYGTLAGIVILMLYIYYSAAIMLIGAEMNQVIEENTRTGGRVASADFVDTIPAAQIEDERLREELVRDAFGSELYGIGPPERLVALHESVLADVRWRLAPPRPVRHLGKMVLAEGEPEPLRLLPIARRGRLRRLRARLRDRIRHEGYGRPATLYVEGRVAEPRTGAQTPGA